MSFFLPRRIALRDACGRFVGSQVESVAGSSRGPRAWEVATGGCPWASIVSGWLSVVDQWGPLGTTYQGPYYVAVSTGWFLTWSASMCPTVSCLYIRVNVWGIKRNQLAPVSTVNSGKSSQARGHRSSSENEVWAGSDHVTAILYLWLCYPFPWLRPLGSMQWDLTNFFCPAPASDDPWCPKDPPSLAKKQQLGPYNPMNETLVAHMLPKAGGELSSGST